MGCFAQKSSQSERKGGLNNLLYVVASAEALPYELESLVTEVTILFPWGSLLKAAVKGDETFLSGLKKVMAKKASLRLIFSLDETIEKKVMESFDFSSLSKESLDQLCVLYSRAGFRMRWRYIPQDELKKFPSTWAKRLAYGRPRPVVEFVGKI